jgi:hypothetical protein
VYSILADRRWRNGGVGERGWGVNPWMKE